MATTQEHIPILDIKDGIVLLKDGSAAVVIETSAVNFGLLSEDEQIAIISSFAQMLNSLSFAIQISILSQKLDISAYLKLLDKALSLQTNKLLAGLMVNYRNFVQSLIKDNEVLDKNFYITVPISYLEMGLGLKTTDDKLKKAKTLLDPRRDQVMRQLARVGLKSTRLDDTALIKLFYYIYSPFDTNQKPIVSEVNLNAPTVPVTPPKTLDRGTIPISQQPQQPATPISQPRSTRSHPFVVEELE